MEGERARFYFRVRVTILSSILAVLCAIFGVDWWRRHHRTDWTRTLTVALVIVEEAPLDPAATALLSERTRDLAVRLHEERRRYDASAALPFDSVLYLVARAPAPPRPE